MTDSQLLEKILEDALRASGVSREVTERFPVIVRKGVNGLGRRLWYYLNYSGREQSAVYAGKDGCDILTGDSVRAKEGLMIPAWDLRIVEEGL